MEELCDICGKPLDERNMSKCRLCGRKFHLAWSVDARMDNCGHVWFDRRSGSMAFACKLCVDENPDLAPLIVDTR